jgi:hypothetical protein
MRGTMVNKEDKKGKEIKEGKKEWCSRRERDTKGKEEKRKRKKPIRRE